MSRKKSRAALQAVPEPVIDRTLEHGAEIMLRQTETKFQRLSAEEIAHFNEEYEACGGFVVVQSLEPEIEKTAGGIIKNIKPKREQRALVVLVGPGEYQNGALITVNLRPGQIVSVTKYGGSPYELEEKDLLIVHYKQIYVVQRKVE